MDLLEALYAFYTHVVSAYSVHCILSLKLEKVERASVNSSKLDSGHGLKHYRSLSDHQFSAVVSACPA